jgi:pyruvate formate lyase activating enzyme
MTACPEPAAADMATQDRIDGIIYKIERLAVYDGPGIRTVIFLKGCPLSCLWCASPESKKRSPQTGFHEDRCVNCGACAGVCPKSAIRHADEMVVFDRQHCRSCGNCSRVCLHGARNIIGQKVSVDEVVAELEKDSTFYHRSGGGITLSGGEPLFQPAFSAAILEKAMEMGFHTAMETCGYADWPWFEKNLQYLDLVYVDIKHMDPLIHRKLTGRTNELILENIGRLDARFPDIDLVLRIPVIPGKNDSDENIIESARFAKGLNTLKRIELLPYHRYGVSTYPVVGEAYDLADMSPPTLEQVRHLKAQVISQGLNVRIGG